MTRYPSYRHRGWALLLGLLACLPAATLADVATDDALRIGVLSVEPPARSHADWQPFARYMSEHLGRPIRLIAPRGFDAMRDAIRAGELDFFYINGHIHYRLKQEGYSLGVLQMINIEDGNVSQSHIFVRADSDIRSVQDLREKRIAYVSPMGAGSYLAPRAYLYEQGVASGIETEELFTNNHANSVYGVLLGDYDAAALCRLRYELLSEKMEMEELAVIGVSFEYAEHVIAARPGLPPELVERFREVGTAMRDDPAGRAILDDMRPNKIRSFVPYDPAIEAITRRQLEVARIGAGE